MFSSSETVSWSESVRVPNNVKCEAWGDFTIEIPDSHNLDSETVRGASYDLVIANKDFSGSGADVAIESFSVDYQGDPSNGSSKTQDQNTAAVWLHDVSDGVVRDCTAQNVLPDASGPSRQFGVLLSDSTDSAVIDGEGNNTGYEGVGLRAANQGCKAIRCRGENNRVHSVQVGYWTGEGATLGGVFDDITLRDCGGDIEVAVHGYGAASEPSSNITVEDCSTTVALLGHLENIDVEDGEGGCVDIAGTDNDTVIDGLNVHHQETDNNEAAVRIYDFSGNVIDIDNLNISGTHMNVDKQVLRVYGSTVTVRNAWLSNCSYNAAGSVGLVDVGAGATAETLYLRGVYANSNEAVWATDTGSLIQRVVFSDSHLSDTFPTVAFDSGTINSVIIDGKGEAALAGAAPDATNWQTGDIVEDTDNAGTLYYIHDDSVSGGASQIAT
ncbi:hypothetical protein ACODNH_05375 [Haloarcula sp. NS06]|uniref:hypothetical protein n=1 Tax=Haloarcula sp. NS06 TaxID=3409688 RepID=UPI003DA720FF